MVYYLDTRSRRTGVGTRKIPIDAPRLCWSANQLLPVRPCGMSNFHACILGIGIYAE